LSFLYILCSKGASLICAFADNHIVFFDFICKLIKNILIFLSFSGYFSNDIFLCPRNNYQLAEIE